MITMDKKKLIRRSKILIVIFCIGCGLTAGRAPAQQMRTSSDTASYETLLKLYTTLRDKQGEKVMLERILQSLNEVDSVYLVHYPTWIIENEDLRQRVLKAFRNRQKLAPSHAIIHVVASPSKDEIVQITILGASSMGRGEIRLYISESLQQAILHSVSPHSEVSDEPEEFKRSALPDAPPKDVTFEASLFGGSLRFASGWGAEVKVGNDNLGYPFWSTGSIEYFLLLNQLKLGAIAPMNSGLDQPDILGPITISTRKLNGAAGFAAEFDQPIGSDMLEARFSSGSLTKRNPDNRLTDTSQAYYLRTMAQLVYSHRFSISGGEYLLTVHGGAGYHQIGEGVVQPDESIATTDRFNFFSPYVKFDYLRHGNQMYGLSVQYYSSVVLVSAWTELVKNMVYFEVKYSTSVLRAPKPWEQPYFFMVSPHVRFVF